MPMLLLHLPSRASINRHIGSSALPTGALLQVFKVQPLYARDVWDTGPTLTTNLQDVQQTCQQASDGLKQDAKNGRLLTGLSPYSCMALHPQSLDIPPVFAVKGAMQTDGKMSCLAATTCQTQVAHVKPPGWSWAELA